MSLNLPSTLQESVHLLHIFALSGGNGLLPVKLKFRTLLLKDSFTLFSLICCSVLYSVEFFVAFLIRVTGPRTKKVFSTLVRVRKA